MKLFVLLLAVPFVLGGGGDFEEAFKALEKELQDGGMGWKKDGGDEGGKGMMGGKGMDKEEGDKMGGWAAAFASFMKEKKGGDNGWMKQDKEDDKKDEWKGKLEKMMEGWKKDDGWKKEDDGWKSGGDGGWKSGGDGGWKSGGDGGWKSGGDGGWKSGGDDGWKSGGDGGWKSGGDGGWKSGGDGGWKKEGEDGGWMSKLKEMLLKKEQKQEYGEFVEYKEYIKEQVQKFKEFTKMKQMKEMQEKQEKLAIFTQMQNIKAKKLELENLKNIAMEYKKNQMSLKLQVLKQFAGYCSCRDNLDVFDRLKEGSFGKSKLEEERKGEDKEEDREDEEESGLMNPDGGASQIRRIFEMKKEELSKMVMKDMFNVVCDSVSQYLKFLRGLEMKLFDEKKGCGEEKDWGCDMGKDGKDDD